MKISWKNSYDECEPTDLNKFLNECYTCPNFDMCYDSHCRIDNYVIDMMVNYSGSDIMVMIDDPIWHGIYGHIGHPIIHEITKTDESFNDFCRNNNKNLVRFVYDEPMNKLKSYYSCGNLNLINNFVNQFNLDSGGDFVVKGVFFKWPH